MDKEIKRRSAKLLAAKVVTAEHQAM